MMKANLTLANVWTNRLDTGRYFAFALDCMNLFNSFLFPLRKKMETILIQCKIETHSNDT